MKLFQLILGRLSAVILAGAILMSTTLASADPIEVKPFGTWDNQTITQITLTNKSGASARFINYGATLTSLNVPDKDGKLGDVVLGFDNMKDYAEVSPYMGATVGRFANRIGKGEFTIDGNHYAVTVNEGTNMLHGGFKGYSKRIWNFDTGVDVDGPTVRFTLLDEDGVEGFPGNVKVTVLYSLTGDNTLKIQYYATTDQPTPINLTNHSYFNLRDGGAGEIKDYLAKINADHYLPVDKTLIPTGEIAPVAGTPYDFTKAKLIGRDFNDAVAVPGGPAGYDHALVLNSSNGDLAQAAQIYDPVSGRLLEYWTTEPAMHFYTGIWMGDMTGKGGVAYGRYHALCLESEAYPDAPNHANFPNCILRPGQVYRQITEYRFSVPEKPLTPEQ